MIGRRRWQGWIVASVNSLIICVISVRTEQLGFVPANLFCLGIYAYNMLEWHKSANARGSHSELGSVTLEPQTAAAHVARKILPAPVFANAGDELPIRTRYRIRRRILPSRR